MNNDHIHHWMLPSPSGSTVAVGKCACGESRGFLNSDRPISKYETGEKPIPEVKSSPRIVYSRPVHAKSLGPLGRDQEMWIIRYWLKSEMGRIKLLKLRLSLLLVLHDVLIQRLEAELEKSIADPTYDWRPPNGRKELDIEAISV